MVHAFIEATPGRALYGNKYDADILTTSLSTPTSGAILYKTGPNTVAETNSYIVDVGFEASKQGGAGGHFDFSWSGSLSDMKITKKAGTSKKCEWVVDINDNSKMAENTISFEPGGTFRVAKSKEKLDVNGFTTLTVDAWDESPSEALTRYTPFYCTADTAEKYYDFEE